MWAASLYTCNCLVWKEACVYCQHVIKFFLISSQQTNVWPFGLDFVFRKVYRLWFLAGLASCVLRIFFYLFHLFHIIYTCIQYGFWSISLSPRLRQIHTYWISDISAGVGSTELKHTQQQSDVKWWVVAVNFPLRTAGQLSPIYNNSFFPGHTHGELPASPRGRFLSNNLSATTSSTRALARSRQSLRSNTTGHKSDYFTSALRVSRLNSASGET